MKPMHPAELILLTSTLLTEVPVGGRRLVVNNTVHMHLASHIVTASLKNSRSQRKSAEGAGHDARITLGPMTTKCDSFGRSLSKIHISCLSRNGFMRIRVLLIGA